jgi:hypothetical protein
VNPNFESFLRVSGNGSYRPKSCAIAITSKNCSRAARSSPRWTEETFSQPNEQLCKGSANAEHPTLKSESLNISRVGCRDVCFVTVLRGIDQDHENNKRKLRDDACSVNDKCFRAFDFRVVERWALLGVFCFLFYSQSSVRKLECGWVPVAQPDRASDFGSEGWGFESLQARVCSGRSIADPVTIIVL